RIARSGGPLAGLGRRRVWTLHLHGHGVAVAAAHLVDSERWFLAQTTPPTARCEGSASHSTDQSNTAAAAGHHRRRTPARSAIPGPDSSVRGLTSERRPEARANFVRSRLSLSHRDPRECHGAWAWRTL